MFGDVGREEVKTYHTHIDEFGEVTFVDGWEDTCESKQCQSFFHLHFNSSLILTIYKYFDVRATKDIEAGETIKIPLLYLGESLKDFAVRVNAMNLGYELILKVP